MREKPPHKLRFAVLATDVTLFTIFEKKLHVLLIRVHRPPYFIDKLGLPGGLIHPKETAPEAAKRHLSEKGKIRSVYFEQLYTFSAINRDPRGRVVSVAYLGLIPEHKAKRRERDEDILWHPVNALPKLAYDHNEIIRLAIERLRGKLEYTNIVCNLLPDEFSLTELQQIYEIILKKKLDKRNFRKKILSLHLLKKTGRKRSGETNRPAELYCFRVRTPYIAKIL